MLALLFGIPSLIIQIYQLLHCLQIKSNLKTHLFSGAGISDPQQIYPRVSDAT